MTRWGLGSGLGRLEGLLALVEAPGTSTISDHLEMEFDAIAGGFGRWALLVAFVIAVAWSSLVGIRRATRLIRPLFRDPAHRIERIATGAEIVVVVLAIAAILRPLLLRAPLIIGVTLLVLVAVGSRVAASSLEDLLAGLALSRRKAFSEGDVIEVAARRGMVDRIGLWTTRMIADDGSTRVVPNRVIAGNEITVAATAGVARVTVEVQLADAPSEAALEAARHALMCSPFRHPEGVVSLEADGSTLHAEMDTWASEHADEIARRIRRNLLRVTVSAPSEVNA